MNHLSVSGADDTNSHHGPVLPWLRSLDGLNTHDESYQLAMAGGVTTAQILPGSANNIGMCASQIRLGSHIYIHVKEVKHL